MMMMMGWGRQEDGEERKNNKPDVSIVGLGA